MQSFPGSPVQFVRASSCHPVQKWLKNILANLTPLSESMVYGIFTVVFAALSQQETNWIVVTNSLQSSHVFWIAAESQSWKFFCYFFVLAQDRVQSTVKSAPSMEWTLSTAAFIPQNTANNSTGYNVGIFSGRGSQKFSSLPEKTFYQS